MHACMPHAARTIQIFRKLFSLGNIPVFFDQLVFKPVSKIAQKRIRLQNKNCLKTSQATDTIIRFDNNI